MKGYTSIYSIQPLKAGEAERIGDRGAFRFRLEFNRDNLEKIRHYKQTVQAAYPGWVVVHRLARKDRQLEVSVIPADEAPKYYIENFRSYPDMNGG
ncbi:MAG: hypothetical protein GMKNLPBB_00808 [Myxococcota bacterium]|nr:hypothetical protein [Myxococcota bacterium]